MHSRISLLQRQHPTSEIVHHLRNMTLTGAGAAMNCCISTITATYSSIGCTSKILALATLTDGMQPETFRKNVNSTTTVTPHLLFDTVRHVFKQDAAACSEEYGPQAQKSTEVAPGRSPLKQKRFKVGPKHQGLHRNKKKLIEMVQRNFCGSHVDFFMHCFMDHAALDCIGYVNIFIDLFWVSALL